MSVKQLNKKAANLRTKIFKNSRKYDEHRIKGEYLTHLLDENRVLVDELKDVLTKTRRIEGLKLVIK